jgi:calcineurin-like phosphoesterase family protein
MAGIFFVSDTHFSHQGVCVFTNAQGKMRPWDRAEDMDEALVENWNKIVKPQDKVYHLGDVAMKRSAVAVVGRCNGHKRLVRGNHDIESTKYYLRFFEEVYGTRVFDDMILSHIPLHPESIKPRWTNVHGHVHNNVPPDYYGVKYLNVSIEYTDWRPLALEEVKQRIRDNKEKVQYGSASV